MSRRYVIMDVFSNEALSGNPLAVVLDSSGLNNPMMKRIAREFNISETVFVQKAKNPSSPVPVRIFTPNGELPFAGHPTIGTSIILAKERFGEIESEQVAVVALEQKIGVVRCRVVLKSNSLGSAEFDCPVLPQKTEFERDKDKIAESLGIESVEIGFENHKPTAYEAGVPFKFVPVRNIGVLQQAKPNLQFWSESFGQPPYDSVFVYCRETQLNDSNFHARMFAPSMGIPEDPATGSAVAAFAGVINEFDAPRRGPHQYMIEQGFEIGRPSMISLEIEMGTKEIHTVRIGGDAVILARGELDL